MSGDSLTLLALGITFRRLTLAGWLCRLPPGSRSSLTSSPTSPSARSTSTPILRRPTIVVSPACPHFRCNHPIRPQRTPTHTSFHRMNSHRTIPRLAASTPADSMALFPCSHANSAPQKFLAKFPTIEPVNGPQYSTVLISVRTLTNTCTPLTLAFPLLPQVQQGQEAG